MIDIDYLSKVAAKQVNIAQIYSDVQNAYKNMGYDVSNVKLVVDPVPVYNTGEIAKDFDTNRFGGCWTDKGYVKINPNYQQVKKFFGVTDPDTDYIRSIAGHELGHEIYRNHLQDTTRSKLLDELTKAKFTTPYLKTVRPNKYEEEAIAEYLASKVKTASKDSYLGNNPNQHFINAFNNAGIIKPKKVLDLGCGTGANLLFLKSLFKKLHTEGCDINPSNFKEYNDQYDLNIVKSDIKNYNISGNFDIIICFNVLMWLSKQEQLKVLQNIKQHLANNGTFILSFITNWNNGPRNIVDDNTIITIFGLPIYKKNYSQGEKKFQMMVFKNKTIDYDPPMSLEDIKLNYPEKVYLKLKNDPVHNWRATNGIELIHQEPSYQEQVRTYQNWMAMPHKLKRISEKKSQELFGISNQEHYKQLLEKWHSGELV